MYCQRHKNVKLSLFFFKEISYPKNNVYSILLKFSIFEGNILTYINKQIMKKNILTVALLTFIGFTSSCKEEAKADDVSTSEVTPVEIEETTSVAIDTTSSSIVWVGSKPTGKHTGTIAIKEGNFEVANGKVSGGSFTIDMTSIAVTDLTEETGKKDLETHLKGTGDKVSEDHFFNTTKFPTSNFKITSVTEADGSYIVNGVLTIKETSKEINFPAEIVVTDTEISLNSEPFKINRTLWGVNYASKSIFDDLKDKFVDDEIELTVKVKASK